MTGASVLHYDHCQQAAFGAFQVLTRRHFTCAWLQILNMHKDADAALWLLSIEGKVRPEITPTRDPSCLDVTQVQLMRAHITVNLPCPHVCFEPLRYEHMITCKLIRNSIC